VTAGVVTADLDLNWVRRAAAEVPLGSSGMGWLMSPPAANRFLTPIGPTARRLEAFDASLDVNAVRAIGEQMLARGITLRLLPDGVAAHPAYLAARRLQTLDWQLVLVLPRSELLAEARALLRRQLWLGAA